MRRAIVTLATAWMMFVGALPAFAGLAPGALEPKVLAEPGGRGDQLIAYYDARESFGTFVNLRNEGQIALNVRVDFYGPGFASPFTINFAGTDQLASGATRTIDVGGLKAQGLPAQFGVAIATAVNASGEPIVSRALSGNFTVANLLTNSAWGAPSAARIALESLITKLDEDVDVGAPSGGPVTPISEAGFPPDPGTVIDGDFVRFQTIAPVTSDLSVYYDPETLQPASEGGNQIIFISFDDDAGTPYAASAASTTWTAAISSNTGSTIGTGLVTASGVIVTNLEAVGGAGVNGQAGSMLFSANQNAAQNRLVYFNESLSTFSTGYLLPTTQTSYRADVQAIYDASCATTAACHTTGGAAPLDLSEDNSWFDTVNQPATESMKSYVVPGDPGASFLFDKITGAPGAGTMMPLGGPALPASQVEAIRRWILEGALFN